MSAGPRMNKGSGLAHRRNKLARRQRQQMKLERKEQRRREKRALGVHTEQNVGVES